MGFFYVNDLNAIMDQCVTASWIVDTRLTADTKPPTVIRN